MRYAVYLDQGEVCVAETGEPAGKPGCTPVLETTSRLEVVAAVSALVLRGFRWAGNEWLAAPEFHCGKCRQPAEPDGQGGWQHADPADAAACDVIYGGGMLRSLCEKEDL